MSALRTSLRRLPLSATARRTFHTTRPSLVKVGDKIPSLDVLVEDSPGNKVNLAEAFSQGNNGYIVGVPGAFSGTCSAQHVPSYINHPRLKEAGQVFVVAVNDAFVMKAWSEQLDPAKETGVRFELLRFFADVQLAGWLSTLLTIGFGRVLDPLPG